MLTINISHFTGYTTEDFLEYLQIQQPPILDVILPKESDNTTPDMIVGDYLKAAYAGQLLHDLSTDFFHTIPDPETKGCFSFIIVPKDYKALASHLYFFMASYTGMVDNDDDAKLDCDATDYFSRSENFNSPACPAYLNIIEDLGNW